jgi:UDP-glucose 4-epimerase
MGRYGMVVPRFVRAALSGEPVTVHGDGEQTRCFAHVGDVVEAMARALETPACFGQVINLGSDREVTINELARRVVSLTGGTGEIRHVPYAEVYGEGFEDMRRRVPCLEKARALLGYSPTRDLDAIIRDVIAGLAREGAG